MLAYLLAHAYIYVYIRTARPSSSKQRLSVDDNNDIIYVSIGVQHVLVGIASIDYGRVYMNVNIVFSITSERIN